MKLVDDLRGDFHHSEQGGHHDHAITKTPYSWFFCVGAILLLPCWWIFSGMRLPISASGPPA
ncbi:hypothetical protein [Escherichia coli]|uniref:hypothetical protein n=1 Tax=Escherichia coli TaxID=562 RepID=UPI0002EC022B|nr:hypothetical protein [Escherichia coli]WFM51474.1 hypothetical protein P6H31_17190 [Escherichia coli]